MSAYHANLIENLDDLKALAASIVTYGDWYRLRDDARDLLDWVREGLRSENAQLVRLRRRLVKEEANEARIAEILERPDRTSSFVEYLRAERIPAQQRVVDFERAIRGELTDALGEWDRQNKADVRTAGRLARVLKEIDARRA